MTKISGGYLKGRNVKVLDSLDLRPTTGFFREWLFNVLNNIIDLEDASLLELFSGSGVISLEFISRGGKNTIGVEKDLKVYNSLKQTFNSLGINSNNFQLHKRDALEFLKTFSFEANQVDILFLDPPYSSDYCKLILDTLTDKQGKKEILPEIIVLELSSNDKNSLSTEFNNLDYYLVKEKKSGKTKMLIYQKNLL